MVAVSTEVQLDTTWYNNSVQLGTTRYNQDELNVSRRSWIAFDLFFLRRDRCVNGRHRWSSPVVLHIEVANTAYIGNPHTPESHTS
jgi:hypothetical protein